MIKIETADPSSWYPFVRQVVELTFPHYGEEDTLSQCKYLCDSIKDAWPRSEGRGVEVQQHTLYYMGHPVHSLVVRPL